jgi:hypothetical protein
MTDVVVVGSGRSGSSLVAGLVAGAGHHMGRRLVRANEFNPRGFFEDFRTLLVNEQLLAPYAGQTLKELQRWLAVPPPEAVITAPAGLVPKMRATLDGSPWCRKDPRFCHTLPAWEPLFGDAVRICVFREPSRTANSMVALAQRQRVELTYDRALEVWAAAYLRVLRRHRHHGQWLFVHYDQVLDGSALPRLEEAVGARLDASFADTALRRASPAGAWPAALDEIYADLCDAAGFTVSPRPS